MATIFETLGEQFWVAFFESDPNKRQGGMNAWLESASPVIQESVSAELMSYLQCVLEPRQTQEGWEIGVHKFRGHIGEYQLIMDIKLRKVDSREEPQTVGPVPPEIRSQTIELVDRVIAVIDARVKPYDPSSDGPTMLTEAGAPGSVRQGHLSQPSPNDARSNSLNQNNSAFRASAINRSNQMNPNNPAYRSSRGRR